MNKLKLTLLATILVFTGVGMFQTYNNLNVKVTWRQPVEQKTGEFAALPAFQVPNQRVQTSNEYASFLDGLQDNIDGGKDGY